MTPEEFRKQGHAIVDWIADYRRDVAKYPVMARTAPGDIRRVASRRSRPSRQRPFADIMRDLDRVMMPGITHWQHPSFFGYFPSNGLLSSVLGDFLSTGLGVIGLSWQSSPALTELEEVVCDWMRQMLGLSDAWSGVIHDTASTNAIVALICARERASKFALGRAGLQGEDRPLVVYASAHAHSSVDKAALMADFGRENVRLVPCDEQPRDARRRARAAHRGRPARGQRARARSSRPRERRPRRRSIRSRRSPRSRNGTAFGCTSTRRWPARR